jgi:peptidoglycan/LPS O-acetylase OafA/YrhL
MNKDCTTTIRGIAILIIIIGHVGVSGFDIRIFNPFGGIGVAMFLFLSGYGLTESYKKNGFGGFWRKKILRIVIPYLVWIPIYHIVMRVSPIELSTEIKAIPRYWFIEYLVIAYIVFYLVFKYIKDYAITTIVIIGIISFLTTNNLRAEQAFSFLCGILLSLNKSGFEKQSTRNILIFACALFLIGVTALLVKQSPILRVYDLESLQFRFLNLFIKLPIGVSLILLTYLLIPKGNKPLMHIGDLSYELYLGHVPFFMAITGSIFRLFAFIVQSYILAYVNHTLTQIINKRLFHHG